MVRYLVDVSGMEFDHAYMLMSCVGSLNISQIVDPRTSVQAEEGNGAAARRAASTRFVTSHVRPFSLVCDRLVPQRAQLNLIIPLQQRS